MNFRIVSAEELPYDDIKRDYINGIQGRRLSEKYNLTSSMYSRLLKYFEADGIKTNRKHKTYRKPTYVHYNKATGFYKIEKTINGKRTYGGCFKKRADAERKVRELGWLDDF